MICKKREPKKEKKKGGRLKCQYKFKIVMSPLDYAKFFLIHVSLEYIYNRLSPYF